MGVFFSFLPYLVFKTLVDNLAGHETVVWGNKLGVKVVVVCRAYFDICELVENVSWHIIVVDQALGGEHRP